MSDDTPPSGGEHQPSPDQAAENRPLKATIEGLERLCRQIESERDDLRERLNRSEQERRRGFWDKALPLVAALVGALIGGLGSFLVSSYATTTQAEAQILEQRRKVFASLVGERSAWEGSNIFLAEAAMSQAYYQERWRRAGSPDPSPDLNEVRYWRDLYQQRLTDSMRANQSISIIISQVTEYFPYSTKLMELCNKISNFKFLTSKLDVMNPPDGSSDDVSLDALVKWRNEIAQSIHTTSANEYDKPLSDLLSYLLTQLSQP
jgi:hypothetical protein